MKKISIPNLEEHREKYTPQVSLSEPVHHDVPHQLLFLVIRSDVNQKPIPLHFLHPVFSLPRSSHVALHHCELVYKNLKLHEENLTRRPTTLGFFHLPN